MQLLCSPRTTMMKVPLSEAVFTPALLELLTAQLQNPVGPGGSDVCMLLLNLSLALQTPGQEKKEGEFRSNERKDRDM